VKQHARTIVKPILGGKVESLRRALRERGDAVRDGRDPRVHKIPELHFISCCILDETKQRRGAFLVVEFSFDGEVRPFFEQLVARRGDLVDEWFSSCEGYSELQEPNQIVAYLLDFTPQQAVYLGTPGRSRAQIEQEIGLRARVAALLDETAPYAMSRADRWQHVVHAIYANSPELRDVPARPLRVRLNMADRDVRARFAAGLRLAAIAAVWIAGVVAPFFLALTPGRLALVLTPPLVLGVWAGLVFIRLSPRGLAWALRCRVWIAGVGEAVRTAAYAAPVGGLLLTAHALTIARVGWIVLVASGAVVGLMTVILVAVVVFSTFGRGATLLAVLVVTALLWRFPATIAWAFIVVVVAAAALLVVFALRIRKREAAGPVDDEQDNLGHLAALRQREYRQFQRHLASETDIAPGTFRMRTLRSVLRWVDALSLLWFNLGHLDTITSIHFARFVVLPGRRTLLFLSNYDDRFEDYLGAFSTVTGVTAVWGNAVGFPRPFLLIYDGARAENMFKRYARASQVESLIWFSAYPNLSVAEIDNATFLRESLARPIDRHETGVLAALRRVLRPALDEQTLVYLMDGR
jgi:hypothetical protein